MQIGLKLGAALIAAALLVVAGLVLGIPQQYPGDNAGLWIFAGVLAALALAVRPPVGRRRPWLIAGLAALAGISFFEGVNYRFWHMQNAGRLDLGLHADLGETRVRSARDWGQISVQGQTVSAAGPLRLMTPPELQDQLMPLKMGTMPNGTTLFVHGPSNGRPEKSLRFIFSATAMRKGVIADDYPDRRAAAAQQRLSGPLTVSGRHFRTVLSNCRGEVLLGGDAPVAGGDEPVMLFVEPDFGPAPAGCQVHGDGLPLDVFLTKIAAETSITVELAGKDGETVLTAVIPTKRLSEALRVKAALDDRIRRRDGGVPFTPFVNFTDASVR